MSYSDTPTKSARVVGTCVNMCPADEASQRGALAHELESGGIFVKRYARPAAGMEELLPGDVRCAAALLASTRHLLGTILQRADLFVTHSFLSDRLRSIRADARVQQLHSLFALKMLVAHARYHACVGYALGAVGLVPQDGGPLDLAPTTTSSSKENFDASMNDARLQEILGDCSDLAALLSSHPLPPIQRDEAISLLAEVASYRLVLACRDAGELAAQLRFVCFDASDVLRHAVFQLSLRFIVSWSAADWSRLLGVADEMVTRTSVSAARTVGATDANYRTVFYVLRLLVHRFLPVARARLVAALGLALNARECLPLADVTALLHLTGPPAAISMADIVCGGTPPACSPFCCELSGWYHAARLVRLLGGEVLFDDSHAAHNSPVSIDGPRIQALAASASSEQANLPKLSVRFCKAIALPAAASDATATIRTRIALVPHPTPSCVPQPSPGDVSLLCLETLVDAEA